MTDMSHAVWQPLSARLWLPGDDDDDDDDDRQTTTPSSWSGTMASFGRREGHVSCVLQPESRLAGDDATTAMAAYLLVMGGFCGGELSSTAIALRLSPNPTPSNVPPCTDANAAWSFVSREGRLVAREGATLTAACETELTCDEGASRWWGPQHSTPRGRVKLPGNARPFATAGRFGFLFGGMDDQRQIHDSIHAVSLRMSPQSATRDPLPVSDDEVELVVLRPSSTIGVPPRPRWRHAAAYTLSTANPSYPLEGHDGLTQWIETASGVADENPLRTSVVRAATSRAACVMTGLLFIFGGESADGTTLNDLHAFDAGSCIWYRIGNHPSPTLVPPTAPAPRFLCGLGVLSSSIGEADARVDACASGSGGPAAKGDPRWLASVVVVAGANFDADGVQRSLDEVFVATISRQWCDSAVAAAAECPRRDRETSFSLRQFSLCANWSRPTATEWPSAAGIATTEVSVVATAAVPWKVNGFAMWTLPIAAASDDRYCRRLAIAIVGGKDFDRGDDRLLLGELRSTQVDRAAGIDGSQRQDDSTVFAQQPEYALEWQDPRPPKPHCRVTMLAEDLALTNGDGARDNRDVGWTLDREVHWATSREISFRQARGFHIDTEPSAIVATRPDDFAEFRGIPHWRYLCSAAVWQPDPTASDGPLCLAVVGGNCRHEDGVDAYVLVGV